MRRPWKKLGRCRDNDWARHIGADPIDLRPGVRVAREVDEGVEDRGPEISAAIFEDADGEEALILAVGKIERACERNHRIGGHRVMLARKRLGDASQVGD